MLAAGDAGADLPVLIELLERMHADKGFTIRCDIRVRAPLPIIDARLNPSQPYRRPWSEKPSFSPSGPPIRRSLR